MKASLAANLIYYPVTRLAGERIRDYLGEYRSHDCLGPAELRAKQTDALRKIVSHARTTVPHYLQSLAERDDAYPSEWPELDGLIPVTKDLLREHPERFISRNAPGRHERKTTSGSTGHALTVLKNRDALARERAATWRAYRWAGISVAAPQGLLWGIPHSSSGRLRARVLDFLANRKRLSMFGVTETELADFHRQLESFQPAYLYGYVSALVEFIRFLNETRLKLPPACNALSPPPNCLTKPVGHCSKKPLD
jgi:phenylacetate-CoA ligase